MEEWNWLSIWPILSSPECATKITPTQAATNQVIANTE